LATALMHKDFGLTVRLPDMHLAPTLPLRLNYLLWLEDLVGLWCPKRRRHQGLAEALAQRAGAHQPPEYLHPVRGMDIGCGASCVYGLLASRHCGWRMLATDTDASALRHAAANVAANDMAGSVCVAEGSAHSLLGPVEGAEATRFLAAVRAAGDGMDTDMECIETKDRDGYLLDFTMCNPPFFSSEQECDSSSKTKRDRLPPSNGYTGTKNETIYEDGGEVAFIGKMIKESYEYRKKIRVFSTLVGAAADLKAVKQLLRSVGPASLASAEFCQGRSMRWGLAWTWQPGLVLSTVQGTKAAKTAQPFTLTLTALPQGTPFTVQGCWGLLSAALREIRLKPKVERTGAHFVAARLKCYRAGWVGRRRARRRAKQGEQHSKNGDDSSSPNPNKHKLEQQDDEAMDVSPAAKRQKLDDDDSSGPDDDDLDDASPSKSLDGGSRVGDMESGASTHVAPLGSDDVGQASAAAKEANGGTGVTNDASSAPSTSRQQMPCLLKVNMSLRAAPGSLQLALEPYGGTLGRDGANQLLTYLRNALKP